MPLFMTLSGTIGYGRFVPPAFSYVDLAGFSNWHGANASTILDQIQYNYKYIYDGGNNYILDGGRNMFDVGNFVTLAGTQTVSTINYGTLSNTSSSSRGYFLSQPNKWPQVGLAYIQSGTIRWDNAGTVGPASTQIANFSGTYTTSNQDRYGSYWANQQFGTSSPTICYVWFTIQQSNIGTSISVTDGRNTTAAPPVKYTQYMSVTGSKIIFGQTLLSVYNATSSQQGFYISQSTVEGFITSYANSAIINIY